MHETGQLGASLPLSRDPDGLDNDRPIVQIVLPLLAVRLAYKYPEFRSKLEEVVRSHPGYYDEPLEDQMKRWIIEPLQQSGIRGALIVMSALDECEGEKPVLRILYVLEKFKSEVRDIGLRFLITSKPEPQTRNEFIWLAEPGAVNLPLIWHPAEWERDEQECLSSLRQALQQAKNLRDEIDGERDPSELDWLLERASRLFPLYPWTQTEPRMPSPTESGVPCCRELFQNPDVSLST